MFLFYLQIIIHICPTLIVSVDEDVTDNPLCTSGTTNVQWSGIITRQICMCDWICTYACIYVWPLSACHCSDDFHKT